MFLDENPKAAVMFFDRPNTFRLFKLERPANFNLNQITDFGLT